MAARYLLDTNIASYIIKGNVPEVRRLHVAILPWDSAAARQYGELRAVLEQSGRPIGNLDLMIGDHALAASLILVTNDRAYARIKGLKIQDWIN